MTAYFIFRLIGGISNIILCWVGLRSFRSDAPVYARVFTILNIFEQIASIVQWYAGERSILTTLTSNAAVVSEMLVYCFIFYQIIYSKFVKWMTVVLISLILLRCGFLILRTGISYRITIDWQVYFYFIILIPAFTYFREIFIFRRQEELLRSFTFWMVAGTVFYCAASVVYSLGLNYLLMINAGAHLNDFYLFSNFVFLISNCIYIKAFLCLRKSS